jgi:hypothetical protein
MWTIHYKGAYINGYADCDECVVALMCVNGGILAFHKAKSLLAAKCYITKHTKDNI